MSPPPILVVGAEGSGTTLLWRCITAHPQLQGMQAMEHPAPCGPLPGEDAILHLSLPTLRPMRWVGGWEAPRGARVIVLRRSPLHTVFSAYQRFYQRPRPAWRSYLRAVALEASWIARHDPLCVTYEHLVLDTAATLRRVYAFLGVDVAFVPPIAITDQNDERWRADERFAAHARRAFGEAAAPHPAADVDVPEETLDFGLHGARIAITDASGAGLVAALREQLPPRLDPPGDAPPDARYAVDRRTGTGGRITYRVVAQGEVRLRTRARQRLVDWLRAEIDSTVAERARHVLFVHAGVVGWRGHAIVVPGRSMTGKSRLVAELVRCGATYYSDEFAVFDEQGQVLPYARQAVLRDGAAPAELGARDAAAPLPVGLIVATHYRAGATWKPRELRGVRAVVPIIDNTVLARREARQLLRLSALLAPRAVTLQGPRPEAAEIAPRLLACLDGLLEGVAPSPPKSATIAERGQTVRELATPPAEILAPRYLRFEDFLASEEHARLLAFARAREADFTASGVVNGSGTARVDEQYRRSVTLCDLDSIWDLFAVRLRRLLPHVRRELGLAWFPPGVVERQLTVHRQGGFFGRHWDNGSAGTAGRQLTCVYYFHGQPRRFSGGDLRLYERVVRGGSVRPGEGCVTLTPADNSAVFFSSSTPHEVCPVEVASDAFADSRFAITIWFRRGTRPSVLAAPAGVAAPPE